MAGIGIAVRDLVATQADKVVLHQISLDVPPGEVTALVGANGAGKSTLLMTMAGVIRPVAGTIAVGPLSLVGASPDEIRRRGIAIVPEGHRVLGGLTTADNLRAAGSMHARTELDGAVERALGLFPELKERLSVLGRSLSGGQKQMLSIAQALIARPRFLLVDELSFGLAPTVVRRLTGAIEAIAADGVGVLLVEQFTTLALAISRQAYVIERGSIVFSGTAEDLQLRPEVLHSAYFPASRRQS